MYCYLVQSPDDLVCEFLNIGNRWVDPPHLLRVQVSESSTERENCPIRIALVKLGPEHRYPLIAKLGLNRNLRPWPDGRSCLREQHPEWNCATILSLHR
jgi:hypothetical protein